MIRHEMVSELFLSLVAGTQKKREKKVTRFGARENGNDNSFLTIVRAAQRIAQWKLISSCETIARRSACHIKYVLGT